MNRFVTMTLFCCALAGVLYWYYLDVGPRPQKGKNNPLIVKVNASNNKTDNNNADGNLASVRGKRAPLKALNKWEKQIIKKYKYYGRLPSGELLMGVHDKHPQGFHHPKGFILMARNQKDHWRNLLPQDSVTTVRLSPNKDWIAIVSPTSKLYLKKVGKPAKLLYQRVGLQPSFSPSGKKLVFVHRQSIQHHTLLVRNLQNGKERAIVSQGPMSDPVFNEKGDAIVYTSGATGIASLWKVKLSGPKTQITNAGMTPGGGRPKGFIPPPTGRYPVLWHSGWLVYDSGEALLAIRDNGGGLLTIAKGKHKPQWGIPGRTVVYFLNKERKEYTLPQY